MTFEIVNPLTEVRWNDWVLDHPAAKVFHTSEWARVLNETYGYPIHYGILRDGSSIVGLLPVMEVASVFTGRRGVSLPFSDECAPLVRELNLSALIGPMADFGLGRRWDYLELRGDAGHLPGAIESAEYFSHRLQLEPNEDLQFSKLRVGHRRNVQKSSKQGIDVHRFDTRESMDTFYWLHCQTRRRHGLPPQPRHFFHAVHKHIISTGRGFVLLARANERWVAGAVYFHFSSKAIFKFGASDPTFHHLRASHLVMWEAIRQLRKAGVRELSFGRTDPGDLGLVRFKRGWGAEEFPLRYYRIGLRKTLNPRSSRRRLGSGVASTIMKRTPIAVLRLLGTVAYRHAG